MEKSETTQETGLKVYEIGYLLVPTIADEQVAGEVQKIKSIIEKENGTFIAEEFPELRQLAYAMAKSANGALKQKFDKAYFGWVKFEVSPASAKSIKSNLEKNASILRYLMINTVRENTMISQKVMFKGDAEEDKAPKSSDETPTAVAVPINEEELDKTLENIVVD